MPNWCYNDLTITGKPEILRTFMNDITVVVPASDEEVLPETSEPATKLKMSSLYPCPAELLEYQAPLSRTKDGREISDDEREALIANFQAKYGASDWYDWCNTYWGTKWGDCDTELTDPFEVSEISDKTTSIRLRFESAWSPATGLLAKLSELYPQLLFSVVSTEESDAFLCYQVFHKGQVVGQQDYDTQEVPDEISKLADDDDTFDEYCEAIGEWQCERNDKVSNGADTFVENYLKQIKAQRDKVEYQYKVKQIRLNEEREQALKEFEVCEVITANT